MTFGVDPFGRLTHAAETLVLGAESPNWIANNYAVVSSNFINYYDKCYSPAFFNGQYRIAKVLKIVQIASPDTTSVSDTLPGGATGRTWRWAVRYQYEDVNTGAKGYDNRTLVMKHIGNFSYGSAAPSGCQSRTKWQFINEGRASAGSATTVQSPRFVPLGSAGAADPVYEWESHGTGGCTGAPALGQGNVSTGSGAWEIHKKQDHTVNGVSKPWRLTAYDCQTGAVVSTTYYATKSQAQSAGADHVSTQYDSYKPVDCQVSSWSSWSSYTDCVNGKKTRTRTRTVTTPAARGGDACPVLTETQETSCTVTQDVACIVSDWEDWSEWSACVDGTQTRTRTRTITRQPANGGQACPDLTQTEERDCTVGPTDGGGTVITDPLAGGGTAPATPTMPNWAVPAGIALVAILALK